MPVLPILLASDFVSQVKQSDIVSVGQILAKKDTLQEATINLAEEFGISPKHVGKYLKKNPGDSILPGDIIAIQKGFLGSTKEKVVSTVNGIITRYDRESGTVYIHITGSEIGPQGDTIISPIDGKVSLCNNEKILIETEKDVVGGIKGQGNQETKEIMVLAEAEMVEMYHLTVDAVDKIVLGQYFPKDVLIKAVSMGVKGVIGTKFLDIDLIYLQGRKAVVPVIEVAADEYKRMARWHGKKAYIQGETKTIILLHN